MLPEKVILLVEDDENDVFFFERALGRSGVPAKLAVARDAQQALAYLTGQGSFTDRRAHPLPALTVLDLNLPHCSGMELLEQLRQMPAFTCAPVVVLSSSVSELDIANAYRLGANSYLVKPGAFERLENLVNLLSSYWLQHNRMPAKPSPAILHPPPHPASP